jgi:hypothetical protein
VPRHLREFSLPVPSAVPPDLLDGLFRRLVANVSALDPGALHRPLRVAEIAERLVPYRTHRKQLGIDNHEDYEMTILRLLAGERGYAQVFPAEVADALAREATSVNPDTALFRSFPDATVLLDADRLTPQAGAGKPVADAIPAEDEPEPPDPPPSAVEEDSDARRTTHDAPADDDSEPLPFALDESDDEVRVAARPREITGSAPCPYCGGGLPVGRTVLFCPHCGQNIGVVHCPTCGSELDVGWTFCITCGQKLQGLG